MTELEKAARLALEALKETLLFCETFSNRWDGQTGAHPFGMVERARAAVPALTQALATTEPVQAVDERAAFEAWATSVGYHTERDMFQHEKYQSTVTWELWRVWQARASQHATAEPVQAVTPTSGNILMDAFNEVQALKQQATTEPVQAERDQLRSAQADAVMPLIGPLLDAWENADREVMSQEPELSRQLKAINNAMEGAQPATTEPDEDDDKWRDVALRFDKHRMQALWHLQAMLKDPEKHADIVRQFLKDPTHPAAAVTERKGEPVGEVIWDKRFGCTAGQLFEPLPVGTKLYTSLQVPEDVQRDAERYRWLRDMASQDWLHRNHNYQSLRGTAFDVAIDAARK